MAAEELTNGFDAFAKTKPTEVASVVPASFVNNGITSIDSVIFAVNEDRLHGGIVAVVTIVVEGMDDITGKLRLSNIVTLVGFGAVVPEKLALGVTFNCAELITAFAGTGVSAVKRTAT